jgi:hypothetical protein
MRSSVTRPSKCDLCLGSSQVPQGMSNHDKFAFTSMRQVVFCAGLYWCQFSVMYVHSSDIFI